MPAVGPGAMMLAISLDVSMLATVLVGCLGVAGFAAVALVRFKTGTLEELRAALATAKDEIIIANQRADRLEASMEADRQQINELKGRIKSLENENSILRAALASGEKLAPEFGETIVKALREHEERLTAATRALIAEFEERVADRHLRLAKALPGPVASAMEETMGRKP